MIGGEFKRFGTTRWQVAVHEAAHAVYAHRQDIAVFAVEISEDGDLGGEGSGVWLGRCGTDYDGENRAAVRHGRLGCVLSLVGVAAERRAGAPLSLIPWDELVRRANPSALWRRLGLSGPPARTSEELKRALMDGALLQGLSDADEAILAAHLTDDPETFYEAGRREAEAFVEANWQDIARLAGMLVEKGRLDASKISSVLGPGWSEVRKMFDEMRTEDDLAPWVRAAGGGPDAVEGS